MKNKLYPYLFLRFRRLARSRGYAHNPQTAMFHVILNSEKTREVLGDEVQVSGFRSTLPDFIPWEPGTSYQFCRTEVHFSLMA